jgi:hypothetical protein
MPTDDVTPIQPTDPEPSGQFEDIYDRMQDQLEALCCVRTAFDTAAIEADEDLMAARGLLHRTYRELDRLHTELEVWHMRTRADLEAQP